MNRLTSQPYEYASIEDLRRGLLVQIRRFNRACSEIAGDTISLGPRRPAERKAIGPHVKGTSSVFDEMELLRDQVTLLKNMAGVLQSKFATEPKAKELLGQVEDLTADIVAKANKIQSGMHREARTKVNRNVVTAANKLAQMLMEDYKLKPEQVKVSFLIGLIRPIGGNVANATAEVAYIRLAKLKDQDGYWHDSFYIMLAFPEDYVVGSEGEKVSSPIPLVERHGSKSLQKIFIATSDKFKIPPKIMWSTAVAKAPDARKIVRDLLVHNGIIGTSVKRELPVPKEDVKLVHNNIKSSTVKGDLIEVRVKDKKLIEETTKVLLQQVRSIFAAGNPRNRDVIRIKTLPEAGIIRFVVTLPARIRGRVFEPRQLALLKNALNLDDADVKRIQTALEDHDQ